MYASDRTTVPIIGEVEVVCSPGCDLISGLANTVARAMCPRFLPVLSVPASRLVFLVNDVRDPRYVGRMHF